MKSKIKFGVSSCLRGEKVRWNGDHKQGRYVRSEFGSHKVKHGPGMFAQAFTQKFPLIPTEDEGRLNVPRIRENFIVKVFSFYRLKNLFEKEFSSGALVKFHTQNKILLLAHSRKHYDSLGQLVAKPKSIKAEKLKEKYGKVFKEALALKSTAKKIPMFCFT